MIENNTNNVFAQADISFTYSKKKKSTDGLRFSDVIVENIKEILDIDF